MGAVILILVFAALVGFPGFYIITRKVFKGGSRKAALWLSALVTLLLVVVLAVVMAGAPL